MSPLEAVLAVVGLIAVTTVVGLIWKARTGRVTTPARATSDNVVTPADVGTDAPFGEKATLLQFSTEFCAYCPATRRVLGALAERNDGVEHIDIDLTHSPELAQRFNVLQTPTTLVLDGSGAVRARIGGAPKRPELEASLAEILLGETRAA
ncbi:thioredoxin family protein [Gryllotalpicola daejeonensis]|uniref:TlpA family protein disulfide reductase n=1 Tax=Gryllotalpicola daejeonensis TaxID=993087 RepID=UPI0031D3B740